MEEDREEEEEDRNVKETLLRKKIRKGKKK